MTSEEDFQSSLNERLTITIIPAFSTLLFNIILVIVTPHANHKDYLHSHLALAVEIPTSSSTLAR
jgi:hypothetical protein